MLEINQTTKNKHLFEGTEELASEPVLERSRSWEKKKLIEESLMPYATLHYKALITFQAEKDMLRS